MSGRVAGGAHHKAEREFREGGRPLPTVGADFSAAFLSLTMLLTAPQARLGAGELHSAMAQLRRWSDVVPAVTEKVVVRVVCVCGWVWSVGVCVCGCP